METARGEGRYCLHVIRDGVEVARREGHNTIVVGGFALLANRAFSNTPKAFNYMQLGSGGTAATSAQTNIATALSSATLASRQAATAAMSGTRTAKWEHTWATGDFSAAVREVGLFNVTGTGSGTMFARFTFTTVTKTNSDTLKVTWNLSIS